MKKILVTLILCVSITLCMTLFASAEETVPAAITWFNTNKTATITSNGDTAATAKQGKSDVKKVQYSLNGGTFTDYTTGVPITNEGKNTVVSKTIDNAGNETLSTQDVYIDKTKAVIITEGNPTQWAQQATITAKATDALSGVKSISNGATTVDGDTIQTTVNELCNVTFSTTDKATNITTKTEAVTMIDNLPPLPATITIS